MYYVGVNICPANFTETLETGVVLCQLAKLIERKAGEVGDAKVWIGFCGWNIGKIHK